MIGIGTLINTAGIIAGGVLGAVFGKSLKERHRQSLCRVCGVSVLFVGISGALEGMMKVEGGSLTAVHSMLVVICLVLGTMLGELINIEGGFERFGNWLKIKSKSENDAGFLDAFLTATFTVCIGAMAVVGSIEDGVSGDWTVLGIKTVLDTIIIIAMTSSMGKGCIFSAIPVLLFQGLVTVLAVLIKPLFTELAISYLSMIGSVLIFCVGINLIWGKRIRVANMLPALIFAIAAAFLSIDI